MSARRASWLRAFTARVRGVLRGSRHDERFDEEIQERLRLLTDRYLAQGMSREAAALAARQQFGTTTLLQEDGRALQTLPSIETLWHDVRYALRAVGRICVIGKFVRVVRPRASVNHLAPSLF